MSIDNFIKSAFLAILTTLTYNIAGGEPLITTAKPEWLRKRIDVTELVELKRRMRSGSLHTICEEALCPNISECFSKRQATFLILGAVCTRACKFCNVSKGKPLPPDTSEPASVASAVRELGLRHVVVTSPTRDDLPDGGAAHFSETVRAIRETNPQTRIELLVPDFGGDTSALRTVLDSAPDILGHNIETVRRLYPIRAGADYDRSLALLANSRELSPGIPTKSGIMLGLGENDREISETMDDLLSAGCRLLSVGQYLAPSKKHAPVVEYVEPDQFERWKEAALAKGFEYVESGAYVRSSYHAENYLAGENNENL